MPAVKVVTMKRSMRFTKSFRLSIAGRRTAKKIAEAIQKILLPEFRLDAITHPGSFVVARIRKVGERSFRYNLFIVS